MTSTFTLNNGVEMPVLGFGVFQIPDDETEQAVTAALEIGYRSIDTASAYRNEAAVGRAIAASGIPRDELFITTKLWIQQPGDEDATRRAFDASLEKLGIDRVDLYLIHQPYGDYYSQWRAMQRIYGEGRARAIGVSNFAVDRLLDLVINNDIVPAVNQIETHPLRQQRDYQQRMVELGVQIEAWAPLAKGAHGILEHPVLTGIAEAHGRTVGQVILRWLTQRGVIAIPKTTRRERMVENLASQDFDLTPEDLDRITSVETGETPYFDHRDPATVQRLAPLRVD